jgi:cytochrome c-type biogenesis protein CcmH/NrfG
VNASLKMLERLLATDENNRDALGALASYLKEQGHPELATTYENRLRALELQDPR